ncbi:hypothetical protein CUJ83_03595 [Methanocella sp. CWC-04]|uniref:Uncharacterized protein n=1 Tax=Methanooceanicella nereidis TaxID=2052831 RepID=A0AAP2RB09_9EURY|nr:hypothetical protein [Methanocella sp. CWC-04]MCD1294078.1 hypothetical protein [Methanocella sp. CWC-04]
MKPKTIAFMIILSIIMTSGCTFSSQDTGESGDTGIRYVEEYCQGLEHHLSAKEYFDAGTDLWDSGDLDRAIDQYQESKREYSIAGAHYMKMKDHASEWNELNFAESLTMYTDTMINASNCFILAGNEYRENDETAGDQYFMDGQRLVSQSSVMLNRSLELIPEWLKGS